MLLFYGKLTTDLHVKSTVKSAQPNQTKRSIVYSEARSIPRIFSYKNDFEKHLEEMKSWFRVRGYLDNLMKKEMSKVCFPKCTGSKSKSQESKGAPLVLTFHPKFKSIGELFISTCTYYIWIKRLKMSLHLDPWLHFVVHVSLVVT